MYYRREFQAERSYSSGHSGSGVTLLAGSMLLIALMASFAVLLDGRIPDYPTVLGIMSGIIGGALVSLMILFDRHRTAIAVTACFLALLISASVWQGINLPPVSTAEGQADLLQPTSSHTAGL